MTQPDLLDRYITDLRHDPAAQPPPGLDPEIARAIRALLLDDPAALPPAGTRERVWRQTLANIQTERTNRDSSRDPRPGSWYVHTNGKNKEKNPMQSVLTRPTILPRAPVRRLRLRWAPLAAAVIAAVLFATFMLPSLLHDNSPSAPAAVYLSPEAVNRAIFERYIHEAWNAGNTAVLAELVTNDIVRHEPNADDIVGVDALAVFITSYRQDHPAAVFVIDSLSAADADVWARVAVTGTLPGTPDIMLRARFEDGKLAEVWAQADRNHNAITVGPGCTLVDAINAANTNEPVGNCEAGQSVSTDIIELTSDMTVSEADNREDAPNAFPSITSDILIQGNGTTISRDEASENLRFFHVAAEGKLTLENITLTKGASWN